MLSSGGIYVKNTSYFYGDVYFGPDPDNVNTPNIYISNLHITNSLTITSPATGFTINGSATITQNLTVDGALNCSSLHFTGDFSVTGITYLYNTTNSTAYQNGALIVSGGVGIAKDTYMGGSLYIQTSASTPTQSTSTTTGALVVGGGVGIAKNVYIGGTLNVSGITTIANSTSSTNTTSGALVVTGGVGIAGDLNVGGSLSMANLLVSGTFEVTGATTLKSTLGVTGAATFESSVGVSGPLGVTGATYLNGTLGVTGAATFKSSAGVNGSLGVTGATYLNSTLGVTGAATFESSLGVSGPLGVTGATYLNGSLGVTGAATFKSSVGVSGPLGVTGATYLNGTLGVTGAATFKSSAGVNGPLGVTGATYLNGTLGVTGASTFKSTLDVSGDTTLQSDLYVYGGDIFGPTSGTINIGNNCNTLNIGTSSSTGTINMGNTGNTVNSVITYGGDIGGPGDTAGTGNAALQVNGGVFIEDNLMVYGGNICGPQGSTLNIGYGVSLYSVSTINIGNTGSNPSVNILGSSGLSISGQCQAASFNATSDYRIKENVSHLDENFNVDKLNPVTYTNKKTEKQDIGFIAHEIQEIYPYLVTGEKDGEKMQTINYIGLIGVLVKEVQELKKRINELEKK